MASDQNKAKPVSRPSIGYSGGSVRARLIILSRPFIMAEGRSLLTHLFFLASAARVASLERAGVIFNVPPPVSHACTIA